MILETIDTIPSHDLAGRAVLLRIDSEDEMKLRDSLPALALAAEAGARVIVATDDGARAGVLRTPHGEVETPCFVPLATRGSVKGLLPDEVAEIGYEMVLGNTYHLMLAPGSERIASLGGLHAFIGWERAIITDSGGFQVFSLAFGSVADEVWPALVSSKVTRWGQS